MAFYTTIVTTLASLAVVAVLVALGLVAALSSSGMRGKLRGALGHQIRHPITWAWGVATVAMAGSLYLSEIAGLIPCSLCWYQRIVMYPLVVVLGVGALRADADVWRYALPLPVIGLVIAAYHIAIQWMPSLDVGACSTGAPCTGRYLSAFGFVTIPTMAAGAFALIIALLLLVRSLESEA